jgi:hypothetical protein
VYSRNVRVQRCIRPLSAAVLAAGPDVIPLIGPNQKHASFLVPINRDYRYSIEA